MKILDELLEIKSRYKRREKNIPKNKYALTNSHILLIIQEKEREMIKFLKRYGMLPLQDKKILEIGCGTGQNLIEFIRMGAEPKNIIGNDLLENRISTAGKLLPQDVELICQDASTLDLPDNSFDIILQSTVFTSILDDELQIKIANHMCQLLKPNGIILWYDFIHANPFNPDVRAVSIRKIHNLFPQSEIKVKRITLFPFIASFVTRHLYFPYAVFDFFPFLRMHVLCTIKKPKTIHYINNTN